MDTSLKTLQDTLRIGADAYEESIMEAEEVEDLYHNRQYTQEQLAILRDRGQPAETFNIIKLFGRLLLGYYSTVVNTIKVSPSQYNDILTASLLNDTVDYVFRDNHMETEGDKIKLDGLLAGLMCSHVEVEDTPERDQFGRAIRKVIITHVPWKEIILDPLSRLEDYSDARYMHRWKWVSEDQLLKMFKTKEQREKIARLQEYQNHLDLDPAEFERTYNGQFQGLYKMYNNYLLVHSVIEDDDGRRWSIFWCADEELSREEITFKEVRFPYRVEKIHTSNRTEFYGLFREAIESQKAINQAILKIQLMVNTQKALVEKNGVDDIEEFTRQFNRVNAVIPVNALAKVKIENLSREVLDQYTIVDKALDRIQRVLGINDSFLGMAFASDSGRKVKLQQNATTLSLRYITVRIEQFYRLLGWDVVNLIKQYYTATQVLRIVDESVGERWIELNKPMTMWTGKFDAQGQPIMDFVWEEVLDPANGEPMKDDNGNLLMAPVPEQDTEIAFSSVDVSIDSTIYNDEDEKNQLMLETILSGGIGQSLQAVNPAGYFQAASLAIKTMKTKHSIDIAMILSQTAEMLTQGQAAPPPPIGSSPKSQEMKLPQNTNEGV